MRYTVFIHLLRYVFEYGLTGILFEDNV